MHRAIITVGLGFGDECKGATVDFLCRELKADMVVRYCGGSQAGHNVELPDGRRHTFSQFGAGTLVGAHTHLGSQMIVYPEAMLREAGHLIDVFGITDPFANLTINPNALITTPYHQYLNRLKEYAAKRVGTNHGSCGHGIGETRSYWLSYGEDAIMARDIVPGLSSESDLCQKLELLRCRMLQDADMRALQLYPTDLAKAPYWVSYIMASPSKIAKQFREVGARLNLTESIPACGIAVFEGSQGVLLDEWYGFHPYTTWSTVTQQHALEMLGDFDPTKITTLGLLRACPTRHGPGPFPTHDVGLDNMMIDPGNSPNEWQGAIRFGWPDLGLLDYAVKLVKPDALVVNCLDLALQLTQCPSGLQVAVGYEKFSKTDPDLELCAVPNLRWQNKLTMMLNGVMPRYRQMDIGGLVHSIRSLAPIGLISHGPTHRDRTILGGLV